MHEDRKEVTFTRSTSGNSNQSFDTKEVLVKKGELGSRSDKANNDSTVSDNNKHGAQDNGRVNTLADQRDTEQPDKDVTNLHVQVSVKNTNGTSNKVADQQNSNLNAKTNQTNPQSDSRAPETKVNETRNVNDTKSASMVSTAVKNQSSTQPIAQTDNKSTANTSKQNDTPINNQPVTKKSAMLATVTSNNNGAKAVNSTQTARTSNTSSNSSSDNKPGKGLAQKPTPKSERRLAFWESSRHHHRVEDYQTSRYSSNARQLQSEYTSNPSHSGNYHNYYGKEAHGGNHREHENFKERHNHILWNDQKDPYTYKELLKRRADNK